LLGPKTEWLSLSLGVKLDSIVALADAVPLLVALLEPNTEEWLSPSPGVKLDSIVALAVAVALLVALLDPKTVALAALLVEWREPDAAA